ncbi:MAG: LamG domain-containing protein [Planctomycetota bacterium]|nr:LamG domain-containing protein [Planctomycetota bacterium]
MKSVFRVLASGVLLAGLAANLGAAEKPVAWWKFDAGSVGQAPNLWTPDGKRGGALALSGGAYVEVPAIGPADALTVALWVRPDALGQALAGLFMCNGWEASAVHFQLTADGRAEFSVNGARPGDAFSEAAPGKKAGAWSHIAVVYDPAAKKARFYVDGKLDKEVEYQKAAAVKLPAARLGAWDREARPLAGRIDDVRIYSRALDAAAVAKVAAGDEMKDGLEAWWRLDEKEGAKVADASGKGRDAVLVSGGAGSTIESAGGATDEIRGTVKFVPGVAGNAMRFDGGTTVIRKAAQAPKLDPDAFSIETWLALPAKPRAAAVIVEQQQNHRGYVLAVDREGCLNLQFALGREWKECVSLKAVPVGKWTHVAATYTPESGVNLYLDGQNVGNLVLLGSLLFAEEVDLSIGRGLDGLLDDLVIHNAELRPSEVKKHFEAGKSAPAPGFAP